MSTMNVILVCLLLSIPVIATAQSQELVEEQTGTTTEVISEPPTDIAQNYAFVEVQTGTTTDMVSELTLDGGLSYGLPHDLSLNAFLLVKNGWAEAHIGPTWAPFEWLKFGASIGGSQGEGAFNLRTAYRLSLEYGEFSFSGSTEMDHQAYGGDSTSVWYDLNLMYQPLEGLVVGIKDRRPLGVGPMVLVKVSPVEFWAVWAPLAAEEATFQPEIFQFGVKLGF